MSIAEAVSRKLDTAVLVGDWRNTNADGGIRRIVVSRGENDALTVRAVGAIDWGTVPAHAFAFHFGDAAAGAFRAVFVLAVPRGSSAEPSEELRGTEEPRTFMEITMQANVKAGVLVVATFNHFTDDTGRSGYFDREFFHRVAL